MLPGDEPPFCVTTTKSEPQQTNVAETETLAITSSSANPGAHRVTTQCGPSSFDGLGSNWESAKAAALESYLASIDGLPFEVPHVVQQSNMAGSQWQEKLTIGRSEGGFYVRLEKLALTMEDDDDNSAEVDDEEGCEDSDPEEFTENTAGMLSIQELHEELATVPDRESFDFGFYDASDVIALFREVRPRLAAGLALIEISS